MAEPPQQYLRIEGWKKDKIGAPASIENGVLIERDNPGNSMAKYFNNETLANLNKAHKDVRLQFDELLSHYLTRNYENERAREFAVKGFARRLGTLVRAIDQVYEALPPELDDIPDRDKVLDATIAIQSFVFNVFGCLDNLAWVWVHEKQVKKQNGAKLSPSMVGLFGEKFEVVRNSFSPGFRTYLESRQEWFNHIKDFRDALAHRIPLYIPPYIVAPDAIDEYDRLERAFNEALRRQDFAEYERLKAEQKKLGIFRPWITHSFHENAKRIVFHNQLIQDFITIHELGMKMLAELDS